MIGKISIGKSFRGVIRYCLEEKQQPEKLLPRKERGEILYFNQCYGTKNELIRQFGEVRALNSRVKKPVWHTSLSFAKDDPITLQQKIEIAQELAKTFHFEENQYLVIQHQDTGHEHLHIIANRIGFSGKTVSDSHNYQRIAAFCRKMEQRYRLIQVLNPRRFQSKAERLLPRKDIRKEQLKACIRETIRQSTSFADFHRRMVASGYQVEKGRGIAFTDRQAVRFKGSQVGYSLKGIEQLIRRQQKLSLQKKQNLQINPSKGIRL